MNQGGHRLVLLLPVCSSLLSRLSLSSHSFLSNVPGTLVINTNNTFLDHWRDCISYLLVLSDKVAPPLCA
jgi:hypothetical protein